QQMFLLWLYCLDYDYHLVIAPQSPVVQIGSNLTAICMINNTTEVTADDLYWKLSEIIPKEHYIKINSSALNVTVTIRSEKSEWLFCSCKTESHYVVLNRGKFTHGIWLRKGYRPEKPKNLSCIAVQESDTISSNIKCQWEAVGHQTEAVPTNYTLDKIYTASILGPVNKTTVDLNLFPHHMELEIWVVAQNELGKEESEHLIKLANCFVKTKPPSVAVISEAVFPTSLVMSWNSSIDKSYLETIYEIRFCPLGSQKWFYVPLADTSRYIQSFRLQNLQPDTVYVTQVRCKYNNNNKHCGYWSDWSSNVTERTPEDLPKSKPDVWIITTVCILSATLLIQDPEFSNGRIRRFNIMIEKQKDSIRNGTWEIIPVNRSLTDGSSSKKQITPLKTITLDDEESVTVYVTAINSVGASPQAKLIISRKTREPPAVEKTEVQSHNGQLFLSWKPPNRTVSEYVVEWVSDGERNWQRENGKTNYTAIKGDLKQFVQYRISVYPIYGKLVGKPVLERAYFEQGVPSQGPIVNLSGDPGCYTAKLEWDEIPLIKRRGFITNYTIYYRSGTETRGITVPANTTSYILTSLSRNTKYDIWIKASTIRGSVNGSNHSFTTLKYAPGEIEGIVVGVSLGFLFVVLMTMLLCFCKKDVIKDNFWPQIPNPGDSTIGNWSPDYPLKAEAPRENCLSGISVLNVDVCDAKCVFEEDKASLPLKKDKYLSEEHSSGIGGSSCMSSPRQSVSDSDEGGDMADTTASTIQYSSVVASSGYKGQNPSSLPQQSIFSRSESTQPLLDCEENHDTMVQEGSRQCFLRQPCFTHNAGNENATDSNDFNPLEMEQQEVLDFSPVSSYMPQLGGYRPQ
uniref:Fibronectin type-III domain-containing protein n=1 Tax=Astatotilapia calliptera TaxID=8154 RepID=A0A3P8QG96_ASTCA